MPGRRIGRRSVAATAGAGAGEEDVQVRILRIAGGGDGIGHLPEGRTIFVPRTAPGDLVALTSVRVAKRFARARVGRILEPGPNRIRPPCHHYVDDDCGGCQLQHLSAAAQLSAKQSIVGEALRRLGKTEIPDPSVLPAGQPFGYRTKITLALDGQRRIGLHPFDRPDAVFDLEHCPITSPQLMSLWGEIRRHRRLLPIDATHVVLRLDRQGGRHLIVQARGDRVWQDAERLGALLAEASAPAIIWWQPEGGAARVLAGARDAYPATVFEQVHPEMGDTVRSFALERLGQVAGQHVWDLYAGIGESTGFLLEAGASVESVEQDPRAVALALNRARAILGPRELSPPPRVVCHVGRVEDLLEKLRSPDLVLANPPRLGMESPAVARLAESGARKIVYISCDPATLARDVGRLRSRYRVTSVQSFDLFPQTAHVESVAVLEPA